LFEKKNKNVKKETEERANTKRSPFSLLAQFLGFLENFDVSVYGVV
jgi:hypothetical protein